MTKANFPFAKVLDNEMPEGCVDGGSEDEASMRRTKNDPHRALDINLDEPLKEHEKIQSPAHRVSSNSQIALQSSAKTDAKKSEKFSKKTKKEEDKPKKESSRSKKSKKSTAHSPDLLIRTDPGNNNGDLFIDNIFSICVRTHII